jgi:hypothetical protein
LAENEAQARATAEAIALKERDLAQAQRLAAEANSLFFNNGDVNLIALLAIRSLTMQYTPSGDAVLVGLIDLGARRASSSSHCRCMGRGLLAGWQVPAAGGRSDRRLWDLATGEPSNLLRAHR